MKAKYFTMIMATLALSFAFMSCSNDDEEDPIADVVSGTYEGYSQGVFFGGAMQQIYDNVDVVTVTKVTDKTVKIEYSGAWGEITIPEVTVTATDTGYDLGTYTPAEGTGNWNAEMSGHSAGNYDGSFNGGTIGTDGSFEFVFYAEFMSGTTVTCSSSIEQPTEE